MTTPQPTFTLTVSQYPGDENPRTISNVHDFDVDEGHLIIDHSRTDDGYTRAHYAPTGWSTFEVTGIPNRTQDKPGRGPRR